MTRRGTRAGRRTGSNAPRIAVTSLLARVVAPAERSPPIAARAEATRQIQPAAHAPGERPRLVVPALGQPPPRERHPRDRVAPAADSTATMASASAAATLRHPENFSRWIAARAGPAYRNGDAGDADGRRRAVAGTDRPRRAMGGRTARTTAAPSASSAARQPSQNGHGPVAAPRASRREDDVERPAEHGATLPAATDTGRATPRERLRQIQLDRRGEAARRRSADATASA